MNISHLYYKINGNWGDVVVGDITKKIFDFFLNSKNNYIDFNIDNDFVDYNEINKNDLLLIGGGGIFLWLGYLLSRTNELKDIKIPIIIYSIGLNSFRVDGDIHNCIQYSNEWLELLKEKCLFISARNDGTKEEILNFNKVEFNESPEPCIYTSNFYNSLENTIKEKYILFCLANDMQKNRLDVNNINFEIFKERINKLKDKIKKLGYKIQVINHRKQDEEYNLESEIEWDINNELINNDIKRGLSLYQYADIVITMRGHGQIIPFSYNVPIITIANQRKNYGFAESAEINDYLIDVAEKEMIDMIEWAIYDINKNREKIQEKMIFKKKEFWQKTVNDFENIKGKLGIV